MTPTNWTGARWLADAEKNVPDPPSTLSALPKGVSTESSATDPTTRTVMGDDGWSHAVRRGDAKDLEAIAQNDLRGPRENEPRPHDRRRLVEDMRLVVPQVDLGGGVVQVARDSVRLEGIRRSSDERREVEQRLHELRLFGKLQYGEVDVVPGDRGHVDLADAEDSRHTRVRH